MSKLSCYGLFYKEKSAVIHGDREQKGGGQGLGEGPGERVSNGDRVSVL